MAPLNKAYKVRVTITEIMGDHKCSQGYKVGTTWLIEKNVTPTDMCQSAFNAIYPTLRTLRYGGELPWAKDKDVVSIPCPDLTHIVVYELRRLPPD